MSSEARGAGHPGAAAAGGTAPTQTPIVIVWGLSRAQTMEHAFPMWPSATWRRDRPPRGLCGSARSRDKEPAPGPGLPRCKKCEQIAAGWISRGAHLAGQTGH